MKSISAVEYQVNRNLICTSEKIKVDIEKAKSKKKSVVTDVEDISETSEK